MFQPRLQIPSKNPWLGPLIFSFCFHAALPIFLHTGGLLFKSHSILPEVYTVTLFNADEIALPPAIEKKAPVTEASQPVAISSAPEAVSLRPRKYTATKKKKKKKIDHAFRQRELNNALDRIKTRQAAERARLHKEKAVDKAIAAIQNRLRSSSTRTEKGLNNTQGGLTGKGSSVELDSVTRQYYAAVAMQIQENWVLPDLLTGQKDLQAVLFVKVMRSGEVSDMRFEKKSSNSYFNQFVLKAMREASPLPPFPQKVSTAVMEFGFVFRPGGLM